MVESSGPQDLEWQVKDHNFTLKLFLKSNTFAEVGFLDLAEITSWESSANVHEDHSQLHTVSGEECTPRPGGPVCALGHVCTSYSRTEIVGLCFSLWCVHPSLPTQTLGKKTDPLSGRN